MKLQTRLIFALSVGSVFTTTLSADEVTDWNQLLLDSANRANTSPLALTRFAAMVQAAVFDALNGVQRRYTPIHVTPAAPPGTSARAAVIQAAYATLVGIYPDEKNTFDWERTNSLKALASIESAHAIPRAIAWGQTVAEAILDWRATDGFTTDLPPYLGGTAPGEWRPTPPAFSPGIGLQFASMTPWVIPSPSQFRPAGPPPLSSPRYTADFHETKSFGSAASAVRTPDETTYSQFWNSTSAAYAWNRVAVALGNEKHYSLAKNARLLALVNLAMADAEIACFDAKYAYSFWRPVTAIPLADIDGNPHTNPDPNWTPLVVTPAFPEYPSAHSTFSSAAIAVLTVFFGENSSFSVDSYGMPGGIRSFSNFSSATAEIKNARIFGGLHFRSACNDGEFLGTSVAEYVLDHAILPIQ